MRLTREDVRRVRCAECKAEPGERCKSYRNGKGRERETNHQARVNRAQARLGHLTKGNPLDGRRKPQ